MAIKLNVQWFDEIFKTTNKKYPAFFSPKFEDFSSNFVGFGHHVSSLQVAPPHFQAWKAIR